MKRNIILLTTLFVLIIVIISSISVMGIKINIPKNSTIENDGRIYGGVYYQGKCIEVPRPNIKIACGRNLRDYKTDITDSSGHFEFKELSYDSKKGTIYFVWVVPGQRTIFLYITIVMLKENNPEEYVHFMINFIFKNNLAKSRLLPIISWDRT